MYTDLYCEVKCSLFSILFSLFAYWPCHFKHSSSLFCLFEANNNNNYNTSLPHGVWTRQKILMRNLIKNTGLIWNWYNNWPLLFGIWSVHYWSPLYYHFLPAYTKHLPILHWCPSRSSVTCRGKVKYCNEIYHCWEIWCLLHGNIQFLHYLKFEIAVCVAIV